MMARTRPDLWSRASSSGLRVQRSILVAFHGNMPDRAFQVLICNLVFRRVCGGKLSESARAVILGHHSQLSEPQPEPGLGRPP